MTKRRAKANPSGHHSKRTNRGKIILSDVTNAIHNAINWFESEDIGDDEILRHSETILDDLQELDAAIRAARATVFGESGKHVAALREASKAIETRPNLPRGYLVAANLYSAQGQHKPAIQILEEGLRAVLPSNWPTLYDKRVELKRCMEVKVDFISKLPSEVISRIFVYVSQERKLEKLDDIMTCTAVSKRWRASALQCSRAWKSADIGDDSSWYAPTPLFQSISTFVTDLCIGLLLDDRSGFKLLDMASSGMFQSVQKLSITNYVCSNRQLELYKALIVVFGKQLTGLNITIVKDYEEEDTAMLPLDLIMTVCPNVKRFELGCDEPMTVFTLPPSADVGLLLNLETIKFSESAQYLTILQWLIPRCPRLHRLNVTYFPFELLPSIDQHCHSLKELCIASSFALSTMRTFTDNGKQMGLQQISCGVKGADVTDRLIRDLVPFFLKSKDTLEGVRLDVNGYGPTAMRSHWNSIASEQYSHMTVLDLQFDQAASKRLGNGVSKLLRHCPNLEKIFLSINGKVPDDLFTSLIDMPHLYDLAICGFQSCDDLDQFLKHHSALGQQSSLQILRVSHCSKMTDHLLDAIADITTLRIIHFEGHLPSTTNMGMTQFFRKVAMNVNLDTLMMHNVLHLNIDSGKELAEISNMTRKIYYRGTSKESSVELKRRK